MIMKMMVGDGGDGDDDHDADDDDDETTRVVRASPCLIASILVDRISN